MQKKLESDLMSLAHSILKMKNKDDVFALKEKSKEIYEKLSMLAFVEEYVKTTPNLQEPKELLVTKVEKAFENKEAILENKAIEEAIKTEETILHHLNDELKPEIKIDEKPEIIIEEKQAILNEVEAEEVKNNEIIEQPFDELEGIMFAKVDTVTNLKNDVKDVGERKTPTLEEELQDTISVDVMADLFESMQPKSLNDKLA